jgi:hypothetical protein
MNTFQSTISSPRNQRIIFWVALAVLVGGVVFMVVKLAGGSDPTPLSPDKGFKPTLPAKTQPLKTASGAKITTYQQLAPQIREAIRGFVVPGAINGDYGASWKYTAPNITEGMSQHKWATVNARSVIPVTGYTYKGAHFNVEEATTKEVLVVLELQPAKGPGRPVPMRIGLVPYGKGSHARWLVNYWAPATNQAAVPYGG